MEAADHDVDRAGLHLVQCGRLPPGLPAEESGRVHLSLHAGLATPVVPNAARNRDTSWQKTASVAREGRAGTGGMAGFQVCQSPSRVIGHQGPFPLGTHGVPAESRPLYEESKDSSLRSE